MGIRTRKTSIALLALALFAASCGDSSDDGLFNGSSTEATSRDYSGGFFEEDAPSATTGAPTAATDAEAEYAAAETTSASDDYDTAERSEAATQDDEGLFAREESPPEDPPEQGLFADYGIRTFVSTTDDSTSTFALDVDTGAYSLARRTIEEGYLPPLESVRVEEFINAFDYGYAEPREALGLSMDGGPSPFDEQTYLIRIGVQAKRIGDRDRPPASLTFVIDTSGSMDRSDRLGLVKKALFGLVDSLNDDDEVAIVIYSDNSGVILEPTRVENKLVILAAIDRLRPGGSTNLESGLRSGYAMADDAYRRDGVNRVILLSDGIANVGTSDPQGLSQMIRDDADRGIQLLTVGFGLGGYNDTLMEQLADRGDGFYAYVDSEDEANELFNENLTSTLVTVAIDAKIQVEFDENIVDEYRLLGFENRGIRDNDFRNNDVDAGELGAGHQVTAIYEVLLHRDVSLRDSQDLARVMLRWEEPGSHDLTEIETRVELSDIEPSWNRTSKEFRLATTVATFAEQLRHSRYADDISTEAVVTEAANLAREINNDDVWEFADLVAKAARN